MALAQSGKPQVTGLGPDLDGVWEGMFQAGGDAMAVAFNVATVQDKTTITVDILDQAVLARHKRLSIPLARATLQEAGLIAGRAPELPIEAP